MCGAVALVHTQKFVVHGSGSAPQSRGRVKDRGRGFPATDQPGEINAAVIATHFWLPQVTNYGLSGGGTGLAPSLRSVLKTLRVSMHARFVRIACVSLALFA